MSEVTEGVAASAADDALARPHTALAGARVVVGVPAYADPDGARRTVVSLLAQGIDSLAVVMVDDDPSGGAAVAVRDLAHDPRLSVHRNERRLGLAKNWQRVLELALELAPQVEYFAWASDHDVYPPDWLAPLVDCLDAERDAVLACGRGRWVRPVRKAVSPRPSESQVVDVREVAAAGRVRTFLSEADSGAMTYGLIRVDALRRTGMFRALLLPDRLLLIELATLGTFRRVEKSTWGRVRHPGGRDRQRLGSFPDGAPWWAHLHPRLVHAIVLGRGLVRPRHLRLGEVGWFSMLGIAWLGLTATRGVSTQRRLGRTDRPRRSVGSVVPRGETGGTRVLVAVNDSWPRNVENFVVALRRVGCEVVLAIPRRGDASVMDAMCERNPGVRWVRTPSPSSRVTRVRKRTLAMADALWYQGWLANPAVGHQRRKLVRAHLSVDPEHQPPRWVAMLRARLLRVLASRLHADPEVLAWLGSQGADVIVVVPGVSLKRPEAEVIAAANELCLPTVSAIASWDNLTTKGMVRLRPERLVVWGEAQRGEARRLHHIPRRRVKVVGAHTYDHWRRDDAAVLSFEELRSDLCAGAFGRYVLWVGSTRLVESEEMVVSRWLEALALSPRLASPDVVIVVRPHPSRPLDPNLISIPPSVRCVIREGNLPISHAGKQTYRTLLTHAAAVVGINTSALWEAAVLGAPALSFAADNPGQSVTHARYLHGSTTSLFGARLPTLEEHVSELERCLDGVFDAHARGAAFVRSHMSSPVAGTPAADVFARVVVDCARNSHPRRRVRVAAHNPVARFLIAAATPRAGRTTGSGDGD